MGERITVNIVIESIRKLMRWCPYAKNAGTGPRLNPDNFPDNLEANNRFEGEKVGSPTVPSQHSRLDTYLLLLPFFFTPVYINLFQKGINTEAFLLGLLLSLPIYLLGWKRQMHQYDAVKRNPVVSPSFRKTFFCVFLFLFLGFSLLMVFLPYILSHVTYLLNDQALYSFTTGTLVLMWSFYFQLIYWERKNNMKTYMKREKGQQKLYVLEEKR